MDEARLQAYFNLIEQLLNCPQGDESNILQANEELLDRELLQVMANYAAWLEEQGNKNAADWLRNWALSLEEYLNRQEVNIEEYQDFLLEVLQAEYKNSDPAVVYPILERHQHLLNNTFAQLLQQWARNVFSKNNTEEAAAIAGVIQNLCIDIQQFPRGSRANNLEIAITGYDTLLKLYTREAFPEDWAGTQNNLGAAYRERIRGERAENLELALAAYHQSLEVYTREAFPVEWAGTQNNLGIAYRNRIRGERAENLELALAAYHQSLEVSTREAFPVEWAGTQNNLGIAYGERIRGERAENLELALAAYHQSLKVYTPQAFPVEWAGTQNNLGIAYGERIRGERAENLELAIAAYNQSLEVYTPQAFPVEWARAQNNLGNAYSSRIRGERAENLELAIAAYNQSLEVYTPQAFPVEWATTQNNLGNAYSSRIRGERAENLELAIAAYNQSLEVYTREAFPVDWARTQNNLGIAYGDRIRGERAENLELAIAAFNQSLEVRTRDAFPVEWAMPQNNLGIAYRNRIRGERAENLELAIAAYNQSLEVYTREAFPVDWALIQNNLGSAYSDRIRGERAENLELAIAAYNQSLEVYTREAFPEDWARTQNNLGIAYRDRIRGERAENLELAIAAYNQSLEVKTPIAFPIDCLQTGRNLGDVATLSEDWETARIGYSRAIAAVEQSRQWAKTHHSKGEIQADAIDVYHKMIEVCLKDNLLDLAFTTVESNKSRYLVELLDFINVTIPENITDDQRQLYDDYIGLRRQLDISGLEFRETKEGKEQLSRDHLRLDELLNNIQTFDPDFTLTQRVEPITLKTIQSILDENTVIWEWYISSDRFYTFIITHNSIDVVVSNSDELETLIDWAKDYLTDYRQKGWENNLPEKLAKLGDTLLLPQVLAKTPHECKHLILIPHQYLHLFPIHAISTLQQRFTDGIQYIPSCQLLHRLHQKSFNREYPSHLRYFFGLQNPTEDLAYSDVEVETIQQKFNPNIFILKGKEATKNKFIHPDTINRLKESSFVHFACHGGYNFKSPLESALLLAGSIETEQTAINREEETSTITLRDGSRGNTKEGLTLRDIFEKINLSQCYLVALSACETGITGFSKEIDEYIGLGSGFLYAGSLHVINSLWSVGDFPTALLMIRFYQLLLDETNSLTVCQALQTTQQWMQTATRQDIINWVQTLNFSNEKLIENISISLRRDYPNPPFNHPIYWAAFCSLGNVS
ncbi:Tetratricopeptide domain protein [Gloeothece citriformis PCC 7424]|uniref:Tetratricopeptide domain protein n=1 Tax=Gloeothece citriformis (strain PCC 7424) TaxID=65393 RepID=B7KLD5_GLOC7|nr:CHAT domain-containing tetratricopeptide repeat protein [Gloeothece citriformis]ACK72507.1 Tetratricopeptide domain protein [Gloeothece citriformis PCC 7424]